MSDRKVTRMSDKQIAMRAIREMPDDVKLEQIAEELAILSNIDVAEREIAAGHGISHDEIVKRTPPWNTTK